VSSTTGLVRSELTKILSTRLWWGLLVGVVVWTLFNAGISAAFAGVDQGAGQEPLPGLDQPEALRGVYAAAAFSGAYIFALVLGVTGMTGEHRYQTVTPTFLATPRRARVVVAKALAHLGVGLGYGVVAVVIAFVVGGTVVLLRGFDLGLGTPGLWRAVVLGVLAVAAWTLVGLGIGTLIRNQVAAILVAVAITFLVEPLLSLALGAADLDAIGKFLPSSASSAMTSPPNQFLDLLPWWGGALVLLGYAVLFAGLGVLLSVRRDVT
jgi:ABC-2 type transport system permease protein